MLQPHEELWEMELPEVVEHLFKRGGYERKDKTKVVTYKAY